MGEKEEDIKPKAKEEDAKEIVEKEFGIRSTRVLAFNGYDDLNFLCECDSASFVLKIMNSHDSKRDDLCEAQNAVMLFFDREGSIPCPVPVLNMSGKYYSKKKLPLNCKEKESQKEHIVRLLKYIPGTPVKEVKKNYSLFRALGVALAHFNQVLKKFHHSFYESHTSIWHLRSVPELQPLLHFVANSERRNLVEKIIKRFCDEILPNEGKLEQGLIHGDFNEHNVLVAEKEENGRKSWKVTGILDFGDSHFSCYLFEVAVALCYVMFEAKRHYLSPITAAGHLLAGYFSMRPFCWHFPDLKLCVCTRICQSLVLGLRAFQVNPNNHYVLDSQDIGWSLLEDLYNTSDQHITDQWSHIVSKHTN